MKLQLLSIVAVGLLLSQCPAHADEATQVRSQEAKNLQGEWQLVSIEINGEKRMADQIQKLIRWEFRGDACSTIKPNSDGTRLVDKATFKLDASKSPKYIDIIPLEGERKGKAYQCIYSLEKDEFTLALPSRDGNRPTKFSTGKEDGGAGQVVVWGRVK